MTAQTQHHDKPDTRTKGNGRPTPGSPAQQALIECLNEYLAGEYQAVPDVHAVLGEVDRSLMK